MSDRPAIAVLWFLTKLALILGGLFGLFMAIAFKILHHGTNVAAYFEHLELSPVSLFMGASYGGAMAAIVGGWHVWRVRKLGHGLTSETLSVRQTRSCELALPVEAAFAQAVAVLGRTERVTLVRQDPRLGQIEARSRYGKANASRGHRIVVSLSPLEAARTEVQVAARPSFPTQFLDGGRSLVLVTGITAALEKAASEATPAS